MILSSGFNGADRAGARARRRLARGACESARHARRTDWRPIWRDDAQCAECGEACKRGGLPRLACRLRRRWRTRTTAPRSPPTASSRATGSSAISSGKGVAVRALRGFRSARVRPRPLTAASVFGQMTKTFDLGARQRRNQCTVTAPPLRSTARLRRPMKAPQEEFLYLACLHEGTGVEAPDFLAVVDAEDGRILHETPMPNVGDELHHFGWNRCSSACHGPDRSHLILPGFRSSRIHVLNVADDPRRPRVEKVIEADELLAKTGYTRPHTVHCMPGDNIVVSMLGDARRRRCRGLRRPRREDLRGQGSLGERRRPSAVQLRLLVPAAQERPGLVGVRRAERVRAGLRPRRRWRGAVWKPAALLEPRRADPRADDRPRRSRSRPARGALAARSRRR